LQELGSRRIVRTVKNLRFLDCVVAASALSGLAGCGSSSTETLTADAGAKESAPIPDASGTASDAAPFDKTPITGLPAMTWQYVPIEGAMCRDGSATGIGINMNPGSKNLMIYLEGGGACFNALTCGMNASSFGMANFTSRLGGAMGGQGVFDRTDMKNPMADWSFVYVPFCTGDVHAGNKLNATVPNVSGKQQFVGYTNVARYLARIVPTFPGLTKVLLTGVSAGGFGAAANYLQTAQAFDPVPVYSLDDSGPPMEDPYAARCLQKEWATLWGFDKTILAYCGADCPDPTNYTIDATIHVAKMYPKIPFGLIEDTDDGVITLFYGFGSNNCAAGLSALSGPTFTAGLLDSRMKLAAYPNVGGFIFQGMDHTTLGGASFDTRTAGSGDAATVNLTDWVSTLVNSGTVTNVGP
jgi:Pectinacetylesterase